jgi:hypothetical protein
VVVVGVMIILKCNINITSKWYMVQPSFSALVVLCTVTVNIHCSGEILSHDCRHPNWQTSVLCLKLNPPTLYM